MKRVLFMLMVALMAVMMLGACSMNGPEATESSESQEIASTSQEGTSETVVEEPEKKIVIGASLLTLQDAFYITQKQALEEMAEEYGVEVVIMDAESDIVKQTSQVQDMISMGVDAIILVPVEPNAAIDLVNECNAAGIPVICNSSNIEADVATKVLRDDFALGTTCGENAANWINENLDGKAKIAMLNFAQFSNTLAWEEGFLQKINEIAPESEVVATIEAVSRETGLAAMEDILQAHPEVNFVWGVNDPAGLGAVAAIEAAGRDDIYVTFMCGGDEEAFERLQQGTDASRVVGILQIYPYEDGKVSFDAAMKIINGEEVAGLINTPGVWWDENNVETNLTAYPAYPEGTVVE